jgi:GTP cyclohydrolase III
MAFYRPLLEEDIMSTLRIRILMSLLIVAITLTAAIFIFRFVNTVEINELQTRTIKIAIVQEDITRIPLFISTSFALTSTPTDLRSASTADVQAVIISNETLKSASNNMETRQSLLDIVNEGRILLVYKASVNDIVTILDLNMPTITDDPYSVREIASVALINGMPVIGGVVRSNDNPQNEKIIANQIKLHVLQVLDLTERKL